MYRASHNQQQTGNLPVLMPSISTLPQKMSPVNHQQALKKKLIYNRYIAVHTLKDTKSLVNMSI